jgi:hypothetical protein
MVKPRQSRERHSAGEPLIKLRISDMTPHIFRKKRGTAPAGELKITGIP